MQLPNCPDCGVTPGSPHTPGCDVERCSVCGCQIISCNCDESLHDPAFARWTGFWPGSAEAQSLGIDLNKLYELGVNKVLFIKPVHCELHAENEKLREALRYLIEVKDYKDKNGKDSHYLENKVSAWEQARKALAECGE